ncbi:MAG: hypothetical protein V4617_03110 [Gemmatimonadota bacterium]
MTAAVAAIAAREHAQRVQAITDAFIRAGATAPAQARTLADLGVEHADAANALARAGVLVRGAHADTWYVDAAAAASRRATDVRGAQRRRATIMVGGLVGVLVAAALAWLIKGG